MRVINVSLSELETKVLMIGFEGENQITQVRIDAAEILTDHPNATPTLIAKPLFGFAYPVIVTKEGTDVVWEIDNSVLSFHGDGEIQLTFTEGSVIAKSYVGRIRIKRSLAVTGEAPDPIETWEQAATAKLAEVDAQISELEGMVDAAEAAKDEAQDIVDDAAADIQAAGAAQVQVVQAKGTEVINSIPSDYSTLSGDVTGLKSAIDEKAPAISGNTSPKNSFSASELAGYDDFYAVCDASGTNYVGIAKSSGILPASDAVSTEKWTKEAGNSITVNATITGETYYFTRYNSAYDTTPLETISAGDVINFAMVLDGEITGQTGTIKQLVKLLLTYNDNTSASLNLELPVNGGYVANTITAEKNVSKVAVQIRFMWGTYDNVVISWNATKGENNSFTFYNGGGIRRFYEADIGKDGFTVFPSKAYVTYIFDTKKYVDEHIPEDMLVASDLKYVTPEMYEAYGDGVHDDTSAINAMIADVLSTPSNPKAAIRGFGKYKITSGITLYGQYIDAYFNEIVYNGNDAAVTLIGAYNKFCFGVVNAYGGGANSVGIRCTTIAVPVYAYDGFYDNYVECRAVLSKGNTVELLYPSTASTEGVYYSVFKFQQQYSANGHCIYINGTTVSELDIYGKIASAPNGYLLYRETIENNVGGNSTHCSIRLHQYGIEHTVKNGIRCNAALIQCRTRELMDRPAGTGQTQDEIGGYLFDFTGIVPSAVKDEFGDADLTSCKVNEALTFSDVLLMAKAKAESGAGVYSVATILGSEGTSYAHLKNAIRAHYSESKNMIPGDMYVYYRHIAFKPYEEWYYKVENDLDLPSVFGTRNFITPTIFDINAANVTIRLDYSYCCIAINEFRVIQHTGKTAIVYDKLGNKIFDGTNLGEGTYVFKCSRVPLGDITFELENGNTYTVPALYVRRVYTGENERWTISKENTIAQPSN